jgi:acyl dehydratase
MTTRYATLAELAGHVGQPLGTSDWVWVDQARIDAFAAATGDHQWIHLDAERARSGPFGTTIAHGFLTLSLLPMLFDSGFAIADVQMGVNYGLNRVRFVSPVPVGSRLRAHFRLLAFEPLPPLAGAAFGAQLTVEATIEREGASKPACVAETVSRRYA